MYYLRKILFIPLNKKKYSNHLSTHPELGEPRQAGAAAHHGGQRAQWDGRQGEHDRQGHARPGAPRPAANRFRQPAPGTVDIRPGEGGQQVQDGDCL